MKTDLQHFLPFGSQYYRCPTPHPTEWETDLRNFKGHGFNTIKIWAQWRPNNPARDVYDFTDLERLMDLAAENDLKVIINVILDVAPVWFYREYPDSIMEFADGTRLMPTATENRQIGGAPGPCYHHPQAILYKRRFVEKLAERFAGHPALFLWDLWNEPELTCALARAASESKMTCYCPHSQAAFRGWLKDKYGTIEALNEGWQRRYLSFDEVEVPRSPRHFQDMIDWRRFFADTLTADLAERVQAVRQYDADTPVMVHTVPPPHFNMINACADDYQLAKLCDLFGNSTGSSAFPAALSVCSAKGKPVINAEIHALGGETFNHPRIPTYNELKIHIFVPLSKGIQGFIFWQYRPELTGRESPAWGLTDREGNPTPYLEDIKAINRYLQDNRDFFCACKPSPARAAVIKDNANEVFAWCASGSTEKYLHSLMGAYQAFQDANLNADILTADQVAEQDLSAYKLLYYPLPYYMSKRVADKLAAWVREGGTLVSECYFGAYRSECNLHSLRVPGYGFDELFGLRESASSTVSAFTNAYSESWSDDPDSLLTSVRYTPLEGEPFAIAGYYFCESFDTSRGEAIGRFGSGQPAAVRCPLGKGQGIFLGSLFAAAYDRTRSDSSLRFFLDLAARAGLRPEAKADRPGVRVDSLSDGKRLLVLLTNTGGASGPVRVSLPLESCPLQAAGGVSRLVSMDDPRPVSVSLEKDAYVFEYNLQPGELAVLLSDE